MPHQFQNKLKMRYPKYNASVNKKRRRCHDK